MNDPTEEKRRELVTVVNSESADRSTLEGRHGQVWDASQLAEDFEVVGFAAPFVVVRRKADSKVGSLLFQHHPRLYFGFKEDHGCAPPD